MYTQKQYLYASVSYKNYLQVLHKIYNTLHIKLYSPIFYISQKVYWL